MPASSLWAGTMTETPGVSSPPRVSTTVFRPRRYERKSSAASPISTRYEVLMRTK